MNRLLNMVIRMLMREGINKGINTASREGKQPREMLDVDRQAAKNSRQNAHRARRGLSILRRFMR